MRPYFQILGKKSMTFSPKTQNSYHKWAIFPSAFGQNKVGGALIRGGSLNTENTVIFFLFPAIPPQWSLLCVYSIRLISFNEFRQYSRNTEFSTAVSCAIFYHSISAFCLALTGASVFLTVRSARLEPPSMAILIEQDMLDSFTGKQDRIHGTRCA